MQWLIKIKNIDSSRVWIEILETIECEWWFLKNKIDKLKKYWFNISIDDAWVGYSNLNRIIDLDNVDIIKIDWEIVKNLVHENKEIVRVSKTVIKFIVRISHKRWQKVIAEYVENEEIYNIVKDLWVDFSQWYYFSKAKEKIEI
jgi:EAL domain-containing protein (putative c-di-GMP-specific phosphodiesterase class I)